MGQLDTCSTLAARHLKIREDFVSKNIFTRPSEPERRVVVTGIGLITPLGLNLTESWDGLINGRSGIAPITLFEASTYDVHFAG